MEATIERTAPQAQGSKGLRAALWIAQVLLALFYGMAGFFKATKPIAELSQRMAWAGALPPWLVHFIGVAELAGALGLVLPAATRIRPRLTALAAAGLATIQLLAIPFHISRGEYMLAGNFVFLAVALFVAWGRFKAAPIAPRN